MNQIALCPYCSSSHTMFKYSTANAIYSTDEHGYPIGVTEDTTNYYHCNTCQKDFTIKRTDENKITIPSYHVKNGEITVNEVKTEATIDEIDEKLDKIIKLLEKLITKL